MSLCHDRLGHANMRSIQKLQRTNAVSGLDLSSKMKQNGNHCRDCKRGKQHKTTMKTKSVDVKRWAVIHSDLSGRMAVKSIGGAEYYVTFIDEYSRYMKVVPIATKGEVLAKFKRFHAWFERKYDCKITTLHCDGRCEYIGCDPYLIEHGIERVRIPPPAPELNGLEKRTNRTLMESARSMMVH